jgi:hypothetical protein
MALLAMATRTGGRHPLEKLTQTLPLPLPLKQRTGGRHPLEKLTQTLPLPLPLKQRTGGRHPLEKCRALGDVHDEGRVGVARLA